MTHSSCSYTRGGGILWGVEIEVRSGGGDVFEFEAFSFVYSEGQRIDRHAHYKPGTLHYCLTLIVPYL